MVTLYFQELPFTDVFGVTHKTKNGNYTVLININKELSAQQIINAIRHEMRHIRLGHFESGKSLSDIEAEADAC